MRSHTLQWPLCNSNQLLSKRSAHNSNSNLKSVFCLPPPPMQIDLHCELNCSIRRNQRENRHLNSAGTTVRLLWLDTCNTLFEKSACMWLPGKVRKIPFNLFDSGCYNLLQAIFSEITQDCPQTKFWKRSATRERLVFTYKNTRFELLCFSSLQCGIHVLRV